MDTKYAAAYFDADGCARIINSSTPNLQVTSCDLLVLYEYRELFGGAVYRHGLGRGAARRSWAWSCSGPAAIRGAIAMLPHLRGKAAQVKLLLVYQDYPPRSAMRQSIEATLRALKRAEFDTHDYERLNDSVAG